MVIKLKEGFQDESFVAYYNGELFYTGQLDSNFSDAIQKLISKDNNALKSVCDYLKCSGVYDFDCEDDFNISYLLSKLMYYEAVDGEDYWNFDGFEIFPEYELDESIGKSNRADRVNERHEFRHTLSNDPTDYERYVNYAETLVTVCENLTEAAERCLRRIEDNEEFYTDPNNERWYGFDEKMDQIAKVMRQIESLKNKINTKM